MTVNFKVIGDEVFESTCPNCNEEHNDENPSDWCDSCFEESEVCPDCDCRHTDENELDLCDRCNDDYSDCEDCSDHVKHDDMAMVYHRGYRGRWNEIYVCDYCCRRNYTKCDGCGDYYPDGEMNRVQGDHICPSCWDNGDYSCCHSCEENFHVDDLRWDESTEEHYCDRCYDPFHCTKSDLIRSYSYKPTTQFFYTADEEEAFESGTLKEFYGIELEIDNGDDLDSAVDKLDDILSQDNEFYYKEDGSLTDNGFEIVSHPLSYRYHMSQVAYDQAFLHLKNNGFRSHDAGTCGLHIHVSKNAFGEDENKRMYNLSRFMFMFEHFYNEFFKLTRRTQEQMNRWAQRYGLEPFETPDDMIKKNNRNKSRYYLVNFQNSATVEVRAFRGTLNANTFKASLQLVKAFRDIACSHKDLTSFTWDDFKKYAKAQNFNELTTYIVEKGL